MHRDPIPLFPHQSHQKRLQDLLDQPCFDYLCYRCVYACWDGQRASGLILRDWQGNLTVRRVTPGILQVSSDLRDWVEVAVFLDLEDILVDWYRDQDEEERYRSQLRNGLRGKNV